MKTSLLFATLIVCTAVGNERLAWAVPSPMVEYLFNEGSGSTATNSGTLGSGTNGTINGASYSIDTPLNGGFSLDFNGNSDFVRVPNTFDYLGDKVTVEAWIRPDATNGQRIVWDDYGNPGIVLAVSNGTVQFGVSTVGTPGPGASLFAGTVVAGQWQHIAGVYDGAGLRIFIDGVDTGAVTPTSGAIIDNPPSNGPPAIGSENVSTNLLNFDGKIDDFRIFQAALGANELAGGNFAAQPIPEPAPLLLLAAGFAPLVVMRGRKKT